MWAFMDQEGSEAQGYHMTCPFGRASSLFSRGAPGPHGRNGERVVESGRKAPALPESGAVIVRVVQKIEPIRCACT